MSGEVEHPATGRERREGALDGVSAEKHGDRLVRRGFPEALGDALDLAARLGERGEMTRRAGSVARAVLGPAEREETHAGLPLAGRGQELALARQVLEGRAALHQVVALSDREARQIHEVER